MEFGVAILAAGQGKRMMNPEIPKVLVHLQNKPLLAYVLDTALLLNPYKIYLVIGYKKELVKNFVQTHYNCSEIVFVEQNQQLGTGHAILQLQPHFESAIGNLLILSGDVPLISKDMLLEFKEYHFGNKLDLSLISTKVPNPKGYGRIIRNSEGDFVKIIEDKDLDSEVDELSEINTGTYIVSTEKVFDMLKLIKNKNAQGEYYLTDLVEIYRTNGLKVGAYFVENYRNFVGINTYLELSNLEKELETSVNF
ncbi:MAG: NTP transferase domain-containing protein [Ignavibacteria bacterium]|nr:NTP transferase domain-containing protein [Ignavibacteria bacterium]